MAQFDSNSMIAERNIGHGADWSVLLVTLGGVFLLGEKIQKNLDAWLSIAKRVSQLFEWLKAWYGLARIDESGALAIAINDTLSFFKTITALQLENIQTISFTPVEWNPSDRLDGKPDALYLVALRVNNEEIIVYGIKSKGEVEFRHRYLVFLGTSKCALTSRATGLHNLCLRISPGLCSGGRLSHTLLAGSLDG